MSEIQTQYDDRCIICLSNEDNVKIKIPDKTWFSFKRNNTYFLDKIIKLTCCNKLIHTNCLDIWKQTHTLCPRCPHCRTSLIKNINLTCVFSEINKEKYNDYNYIMENANYVKNYRTKNIYSINLENNPITINYNTKCWNMFEFKRFNVFNEMFILCLKDSTILYFRTKSITDAINIFETLCTIIPVTRQDV